MRISRQRVIGLLGVALLGAAAACSSSSNDGGLLDDDAGGGGGGPSPTYEASTTDTNTEPTDTGTGENDSGMDTDAMDAGSDARADLSCTGLAYCDDFESYTASTTPILTDKPVGIFTTSVSGMTTMTIDTVRPYGGKNALHIKQPKNAGSSGGLLNFTKAAGLITGNDLWGRAMVYYAKTTTADLPFSVHSWIFQGIGTSTASGKIMSLNLANGGTDFFLNYHGDSTSSAEASKNGGKPVAAQWVCMTWEYNSSGTAPADDAKVWADGVLQLEATKAAQMWNLATPFSQMQFGFQQYGTLVNDIDLYIDDIAIDTKAIPCPAAP